MKFERLFEPMSIGKVRIKNRIAMAPMNVLGLVDNNGGFTQRAIDYYIERALGQVGLIITCFTRVKGAEVGFNLPFIQRESFQSFSELAESVHYFGSKVFVQLTAGFGRVFFGAHIDTGAKPASPSAIPAFWRPRVTTRALTTDEVEELVQSFGVAAELLKSAGVDGIELHGHEGYLFDQFATSIWNKRNDKYGGLLEDRLRFATEVLNAIKEKAGKDFPVTYRYGLKHYMKGPWRGALKHENFVEAGRDIEEGLEMAKLLEKAGFDALHVDAGCYDSFYWPHPPTYQPHGCMVDMAAKAKEVVTIPVIAVGRLDHPEIAEDVIREGKADMVAIGRGLLADPHWPKKVREGKVEEIRPCTGCHDGCIYRIGNEGKALSCAVNPATGRERLYKIERVESPKKVVVVGGGIAGMEAARVAASRGCKTTLYEKGKQLGGHLIAASVPDFKEDYRRLLDWYNHQLKELGVEIKLQVEATPTLLKEERADAVIVATGSTPIIPDIRGIEKPMVATCVDLLLGKKKAGERVAVIGGGLVGCETGLWLARQGKRVTIVEILPEMARGIYHSNRTMLLDMLKDKKADLMTETQIEEVTDSGVIVVDKNCYRKTIPCDTVALAVGLQANSDLYETLQRELSDVYLIGDCQDPRKVMHAIWDGYHVACRAV